MKRPQRDYFLGLFAGRCDLSYVEDRLRVGIAHERIGLSTKWYLGAYLRYLQDILGALFSELPDPSEARAAFDRIQESWSTTSWPMRARVASRCVPSCVPA